MVVGGLEDTPGAVSLPEAVKEVSKLRASGGEGPLARLLVRVKNVQILKERGKSSSEEKFFIMEGTCPVSAKLVKWMAIYRTGRITTRAAGEG